MRVVSQLDRDERASFAQWGRMMPIAHERLSKALGGPRASRIVQEAAAALDHRRFDHPQDLLLIANYLIKQGGLVRMVGHSLKVQALLLGAIET